MNLFARLQKPVCFLFLYWFRQSIFLNLLFWHESLFSRENSVQYSPFLFGELCKQNLFFLSLPELAFMFLVIKSQLLKNLFCIIHTVNIINILIKCNL